MTRPCINRRQVSNTSHRRRLYGGDRPMAKNCGGDVPVSPTGFFYISPSRPKGTVKVTNVIMKREKGVLIGLIIST